ASDVDMDALTYELLTKPSGMGINQQGIIGWTPTNDNVGDNDVVVRVKDTQSAFAEQSFVINVANVNDPP
ncbi:MAG: putative Ig domain-containing protein, partial [Nanoarchaeota archaeon]